MAQPIRHELPGYDPTYRSGTNPEIDSEIAALNALVGPDGGILPLTETGEPAVRIDTPSTHAALVLPANVDPTVEAHALEIASRIESLMTHYSVIELEGYDLSYRHGQNPRVDAEVDRLNALLQNRGGIQLLNKDNRPAAAQEEARAILRLPADLDSATSVQARLLADLIVRLMHKGN